MASLSQQRGDLKFWVRIVLQHGFSCAMGWLCRILYFRAAVTLVIFPLIQFFLEAGCDILESVRLNCEVNIFRRLSTRNSSDW